MPITDYDRKYAELYTEYKKDYLRGLTMRHPGVGNVHQLSAQDRENEARVRQVLENLNKQELKTKADNLLQNQHRPVTKVAEDVVISTYDLDFVLAMSLQEMDAKQSPEAEYRDWIEITQKIESDINTNGTTQGEVDARNLFIGFLDHRETEMKRVMALYSSAALHSYGYYKEEAYKKLEYMRFKLSELRRLRTRLLATRSHSDEEERRRIEAIDRGEKFLANKIGDELEENLIDTKVFKPETQNEEEAHEKVENLRKTSAVLMAALIMGYRYGKTREQIEREGKRGSERVVEENQNPLLPRIARLRGLTVQDYQRVAQRA